MKKNAFAVGVGALLAVAASTSIAQAVFSQRVESTPSGPTGPAVASHPATNASGFNVDADGVGHIQLIPYYTVQNSNNTLLNVVNSDEYNGKAVKVRFRAARNSDDVFDFYLLLSPGDVWRSRIYRDEAGNTRLDLNGDTTCTYPLKAVVESTPFLTDRVFGATDEAKQAETREGYVEFLTAADIPPTIAYLGGGEPPQMLSMVNPLYTAIKQIKGVAPCTATSLSASFDAVLTANSYAAKGFLAPSTGLMANWAVMDVNTGSTASGNGTALVATSGSQPAFGAIVVSPQSDSELPAGTASLYSADPLFAEQNSGTPEAYTPVKAMYYDLPDLSTPYLVHQDAVTYFFTPDEQANIISNAMASAQVLNEFTTEEAGFRTDWVFSLPTRRYGVAMNYAATPSNGQKQVLYNPSSAFFDASNTGLVMDPVTNTPSVKIDLLGKYWDKEENTKASGPGAVISPGNSDTAPFISGEVNVFTFNGNAPESILGGRIAYNNLQPLSDFGGIASGWARFSLPTPKVVIDGSFNPTYKPGMNGYARGLPVIGFATMTAGNGINLTYPHRFKKASRPGFNPN